MFLDKKSNKNFSLPFNAKSYDKSNTVNHIFSDENTVTYFFNNPEEVDLGNGNTETIENISHHTLYENLNMLYKDHLIGYNNTKNTEQIINILEDHKMIPVFATENNDDSPQPKGVPTVYVPVALVAAIEVAVATGIAGVTRVVVYNKTKLWGRSSFNNPINLYKKYISVKFNNKLSNILSIIEQISDEDFAKEIDCAILERAAQKTKEMYSVQNNGRMIPGV